MEGTKMKCPECQFENREDAKFCKKGISSNSPVGTFSAVFFAAGLRVRRCGFSSQSAALPTELAVNFAMNVVINWQQRQFHKPKNFLSMKN